VSFKKGMRLESEPSQPDRGGFGQAVRDGQRACSLCKRRWRAEAHSNQATRTLRQTTARGRWAGGTLHIKGHAICDICDAGRDRSIDRSRPVVGYGDILRSTEVHVKGKEVQGCR